MKGQNFFESFGLFLLSQLEIISFIKLLKLINMDFKIRIKYEFADL